MRRFIGILTIAFFPAVAIAQQQPKPDWAFPTIEKVKVPARFAPDRVRTVGNASYTRAGVDEHYNIPNWRPGLHPPMPKIVRFGNSSTKVRACGSCHLPTGSGHPESGYLAGLPVNYFIRTMSDWKTGNRKYAAAMINMLKIISDAEIREAAVYFASLKPTPWIRVVEADTVPRSFVGMSPMRLAHPDGGTEPLGNRIVELPEDEEETVYRDPISGFVAYVPKGSVERGRELATTGGGRTIPCGICHGPTQRGLGEVPGIAGRHPNYIVRQLWNMQNGDRAGTSAALMKQVVEKLTVDDMLALAAYSASLAP